MKKVLFYLAVFLCLFISQAEASSSPVTLSSSNTLSINTYYYGESVGPIIQKALEMDKNLPSDEPLYLVINSGGGSIVAGMRLIQVLSQLNRPVHTITMFSASMGFETVQGLGDRLILNNGTLMSHRASGFFYGEFPGGNLETRYKYWLRRLYRKDQLTVKRNPNLKSIAHYRHLITNEYWCEGEQCVKHGFADRIVSARCDNSLQGTYVEWIKELMNGYPIMIALTYSRCPLQPYLLNWQVYYQGEPLWEKPEQKTDTLFNTSTYDLFPSKETAESVMQRALKVIDEYQSKESKLTID